MTSTCHWQICSKQRSLLRTNGTAPELESNYPLRHFLCAMVG